METQKPNNLILSKREEHHKKLMVNILRNIADTPLVLKGGTALYLGYGLNRFSEDLDFDSAKKLNLANKITSAARDNIVIDNLNIKKDTDIVSRYIVNYHIHETGAKGRLKIEISYRTPASEEDVIIKDGIRFSSLERIIDNKLNAAYDGDHTRTKGRDLFDLHFLACQYPDSVDLNLARRLQNFAQDPGKLATRYQEDIKDDLLLKSIMDVEQVALELNYLSNNIIESIIKRAQTINAKLKNKPIDQHTEKVQFAEHLHSHYLDTMNLPHKEKEGKRKQFSDVINTISPKDIDGFIEIMRNKLKKKQETIPVRRILEDRNQDGDMER